MCSVLHLWILALVVAQPKPGIIMEDRFGEWGERICACSTILAINGAKLHCVWRLRGDGPPAAAGAAAACGASYR